MNKKYLISILILLMVLLGIYNICKNKFFDNTKKNNNISYRVKESNKNMAKYRQVNVINENSNRNFTGDIIYNNNSVPVLMYHSIDYEKGNELRIPKDKFRSHMQYLKDNKYTTLTMNEFYDFIINNKPVPRKSVLITFDDGYEDNYKNAYPVLKEFGFKATVFIITSTVDKDKTYLNSSQLREMSNNGIDIESHTVRHDDLSTLDYNEQLKTMKDSRNFLMKVLNKRVDYIAYPFGRSNSNTGKAAAVSGYKLAFTTESGWGNKNQGIYKLHRVYMSNNYDMKEFEKRVTNSGYNTSN